MSIVLQALLDLQEVDSQIRDLEQQEKDLPVRIAKERARTKGVVSDLESAKMHLAELKSRIEKMEAESAELETRARDLRASQAKAESKLELSQVTMSLDSVMHDMDTNENRHLATLDLVPEAEARVKKAQEAFDKQNTGVEAFCKELQDHLDEVKAELESLRAEREVKKAAVTDQRFLNYYERVRTRRWPVLVSLTHEGVCDGCHLVQPKYIEQRVDINASKAPEDPVEMVVCTMCQRILYR